MILVIVAVILIALATFGIVKLIDKFLPDSARPIVSIVLWLVSIGIAYMIYASVMKPIEFKQEKERRYEVAVSKMLDIKKAQMGYKTVHKDFADSFDKLVQFIENEKFAIISRKDTAVIDASKNIAFGIAADSKEGFYKDIVIIDTLGYVTVKDSLFRNSDRYKRLNVVKVGNTEIPVTLEASSIVRNDTKVPVFKAEIDKNALLADLDQELVEQENKVESIDEINGDKITLGSLEEAVVTGNWPKKYGSNE
ncbi:hypothetical protein [Flavobacterium okayamense]|uniref:Uncharacterized protein n=1 Tax=Flavobacterium okayamense TaxID=2830782 RepID=A0ABN6HXP2_9FLAO|nr:hypothetical protein [Flavobacterium okayamense]BCY29159.1 hypothetical protein KK2020170_20270 [Flavobacterium okayamense]